MATLAECEAALHALAARFAGETGDSRRRGLPERSVACEIGDLGATYRARLGPDGLTGIAPGPAEGAQIRLRVSSDDLVALTRGELGLAGAWASGRVRIDASLTDLLRLRSLL